MALDPLAKPLAKPITHVRPRWQVGNAPNPLGGIPQVVYLGEYVYCTEDGTDVGEPWRDSSLDMVVNYDPSDATHQQGFAALDGIVKAAYIAKQAEQE